MLFVRPKVAQPRPLTLTLGPVTFAFKERARRRPSDDAGYLYSLTTEHKRFAVYASPTGRSLRFVDLDSGRELR